MVESLKVEIGLEGSEQVNSQMRQLGENIRNTFLGMAGAAAKFSATLAGIGVALGGVAAKQLLNFANAAEETEKALTQLQKVSGQSFENLSSLANVFAKGGTELKKFASEFGNLSEKIAAAGEAAAKQQAIAKQAEDIAKGFKKTELGAITLNERVTALLQSLSNVTPAEQWARLADVFKNLGSDMERARIGQALGLSPESIATLSQGSAAIKQVQADAERLGLTLTTSNQQALQEMGQAWNQFTALLSAFFQKIGALAAPAFAKILGSVQPVMQQIVADFQNLPLDQAISNLGNRLGPAFEALLGVLTPILSAMGTALGNAFVNAVTASISEGIQNIKNKWGLGGAPAPGSPSFIGPVQPPAGTGTSDSNLPSIAQAARDAATAVDEFSTKIAGITWDAISSVGVAAWNALTGAIQTTVGWIETAISAMLRMVGLKPSAPATGGGAPGKASGGFIGGRGTGTSDSNLAWLSRGEYIMPARAVRQPGVLAFLEALRRGGGIPGFADGGFIRGFGFTGGGANKLADQLVNWIASLAAANNEVRRQLEQTKGSLDNIANGLTDKLFAVVSGMQQAVDALNRRGGMARGGLLGGRGTGTSDSNLAWLSRGEYITPARAVAQPGVLAFLEALRHSGGNLSRVLDGMGRFALGGMVPRAIPAFAAGGLAGGSNVTIQFPGLPAIGGLRASSGVVDQLHKAAALAQVRSGGRKPSRYF